MTIQMLVRGGVIRMIAEIIDPGGDWLLDFSTPDDSGYLALYSIGV